MHGVKPLHVRKQKMHACKIREPGVTKRCTLVEIGYDFGHVSKLKTAGTRCACTQRRPACRILRTRWNVQFYGS